MKRQLVWSARVAVGLSILAFLASRLDFSTLSLRMDQRALWGGAGGVAFLLLAQALSAERWRILLGKSAPAWLYLWKLYAIGAFFSLFLPTAVGGDAVRAAAAMRSLPRGGSILASVLMDRALGVAALVVYAVVGTTLMPQAAAVVREAWQWKTGAFQIGMVVLLAAAAVAVAWIVVKRRPRLSGMLEDAFLLLRSLIADPRALFSAVVLAFLVQGAYIAAWVVVAWGLGLDIPLMFFLFAVPVVSLASMLPVTLAGIGVREGAWVLLLGSLGLPAVNAVAYGLFYFMCVIIVGVIGGALFMVFGTGYPQSEVEAQ